MTKGLSEVSSACRRKGTTVPDHVAHLIEDNLFVTITNANFDDTMIEERIQKTAAVKEELLRLLPDQSSLSDAALWQPTDGSYENQEIGVLSEKE